LIKNFMHKGLEKFFIRGTKAGIIPKHAENLSDILDMLNAAASLGDMAAPNLRLHLREPKKDGVWSVDVSGQWRVTFRFEGGDAYDVNYDQPH